MNDNETDRQKLCEAVGRVVDRVAVRKGMSLLDVSAALGVVAGTLTAVNAKIEGADAIALGMMNVGFSEAFKAARELKQP